MAYNETQVPVSQSQEAIRRLIYSHKGTGLMLISEPPREGFEGLVTIDGMAYRLRVMARSKEVERHSSQGRRRTDNVMQELREKEIRRVWRVLYWHLKAMFEASDSGVIDIRDVIMPYVVMHDGRTLSEHIVPRMTELMTMDASRLLAASVR